MQVNEPILPANIAASDINALVWAIGEMQNILDAPPMSSIVGQRVSCKKQVIFAKIQIDVSRRHLQAHSLSNSYMTMSTKMLR